MRWMILTGALVFTTLFVATTFISSPAAREEARRLGFSNQEIEIGERYAFERRLVFWGHTAVQLIVWTWIVCSGWARRLADVCLAWTGGRWLVAVLLVGVFCFLLDTAISLPFDLARLVLLWTWELSQRSLASWARDELLQTAVFAIIEAPVLLVGYSLIRAFPRIWWVFAAVGVSAVTVGLAFVLPIVISPLFNTFTPLRKTQWMALEPRVQTLLTRAAIPVEDILVIDASRQSQHTNAYFTGFGATRRIVLYDNLLRKHSPEEIESIVAHEIGHWQHDHIVKGIAFAGLGMLVGFFILSRILLWSANRPPLHLRNPHDPAGVPLILLLAMLGGWVTLPIQNAVSREFERQADRVSLELAGQVDAFITGERKLARDNKINVAPTPFNVWLFASHPPTVERIRTAMEWQAANRTPDAAGREP